LQCSYSFPTVYCFWHILGKLWEHHKDMSRKLENWGHFECLCDVPRVFPKCPKSGTLWENCRDTANVPPWNIFGASFWFISNFTGWGHHNHTDGNTAKYTVNEPLRNIMGTFFGKILGLPIYYLIRTLGSHDLEHCKHTDQFFLNEPLRNIVVTFFEKILGFPMDYLMGTLQSHDLEHCECTGHFLHWEHCNETGSGNSECDCNVPNGFLVGTLSISL